ncbi:MAG: HD domain-containing phosphohydrolase [Lentisphaerota bacterium]
MQKILCLDDEQSVLDGFKRQLHKDFALTTANQGEDALKILSEHGPFAVIVSDMRMPGMDGIRFLARAREIAPDSVRMMLTGAGDLQTAMEAVNEGRIFRFLTKPCPAEILAKSLHAALEQYRLVTAERELLENTLKGSLRVLVDILALTNPAAFSRATRLRHYTAQVVKHLGLPNAWQYEIAALLSQLGCVTLPSEVLEKAFAGEKLAPQEYEMYSTHAQVGGQLLINIPRLETVAAIITHHQDQPDRSASLDPVPGHIGPLILGAISEFDMLLTRGKTPETALINMRESATGHHPRILEALAHVEVPVLEKASRMVKISELHHGMVLAEDIRSKTGVLVVNKDQEVNDILRQRLDNFHRQALISDQVRVSFLIRSVAYIGDL